MVLRSVKTGTLAAALLLAAGVVLGQAGAGGADSGTSASIRLELPVDAPGGVSMIPGNARVVLELPGGVQYPLDFRAASNGLVRESNVEPIDGGRVRLELDLAAGLLDRVDYEPGAVVLHFRSRFQIDPDQPTSRDQYRIGNKDKLRVIVHGRPELDSHLTVSGIGVISAPLVGEVRVTGNTPSEVANQIAELLGEYLVDPQVDVAVEEYNSQWVMVDGEVRSPGRVPLRGGTQLKEVLSEAGGFTDDGGERITISRRPPGDGQPAVTIEIDRADFETGKTNPQLDPGDIVTVTRAAYCYVHGEVSNPTRVRIERGMTLLKALTMSGGLTEWANRKEVKILDGEGTKPRVYNLRAIQSGKTPDPALYGDEIIVVERRFL
jgi:polysaccharide export outer membrane protein